MVSIANPLGQKDEAASRTTGLLTQQDARGLSIAIDRFPMRPLLRLGRIPLLGPFRHAEFGAATAGVFVSLAIAGEDRFFGEHIQVIAASHGMLNDPVL